VPETALKVPETALKVPETALKVPLKTSLKLPIFILI
jgi:hypothetical protein